MSILMMLAPMSLFLGALGVAAFWWTIRHRQYEDPAGDAARILIDHPDDRPPGAAILEADQRAPIADLRATT